MDLLEVGKIINTHGLRGEVKVAPWTDTPDVFEDLEVVYTDNGKESFEIKTIRYQKNNLIVKFKELNDINEAETYKNKVLYAERAALGELPEGVYYIADLIGMTVKNEDDEVIGKLSDVFKTGANDVYEVKRDGKKDLLIPVIKDSVISVDTVAREVIVRIMSGLEEL